MCNFTTNIYVCNIFRTGKYPPRLNRYPPGAPEGSFNRCIFLLTNFFRFQNEKNHKNRLSIRAEGLHFLKNAFFHEKVSYGGSRRPKIFILRPKLTFFGQKMTNCKTTFPKFRIFFEKSGPPKNGHFLAFFW